MKFDLQAQVLVGEHGMLPVAEPDEGARKLAMLIEGESEGLGRSKAARKHGSPGNVMRNCWTPIGNRVPPRCVASRQRQSETIAAPTNSYGK